MPPGIGYIDPMTGEWVPDSGAGLPSASQLGSYVPSMPAPPTPEEPDYFQQGGQDGYLTPPDPISLPDVPVGGGPAPSQSQRFDVSTSKTDLDGLYKDVKKGGRAATVQEQIYADSDAEAAAQFDPLLQRNQELTQTRLDAAQTVGEATANVYDQEASVHERAFDYLSKEASAENQLAAKKAYDAAEAEKVQAAARFHQANEAFAAMKVRPRDFSASEAFATGIQGWLATWGVKVDFANTIQNRIRNEIDIQIANMEHGRDVAQGFKTAYDMAAGEALNKKDLSDRLHMMYLKSLDADLMAQSARAKSKVQLADINAKRADINKEALDLENSILGLQAQDADRRRDGRIQLYGIETNARLERSRIALARRQAAGAGPSREDMAKVGIYVNGELIGRGRDDKATLAAQKDLDDLGSTVDDVNQYTALIEKVAPRAPGRLKDLTKFITGEDVSLDFLQSDEDKIAVQNAKALYEIIAGNYRRKVSGQAVSEGEMKRFQTALQPTSVVNKGAAATFHQFNQLNIDRAIRAARGNVFKVTPEERAAAPVPVEGSAIGQDANRQRASDYSGGTPPPAPLTRVEQIVEDAQGEIGGYTTLNKKWSPVWAAYARKANRSGITVGGEVADPDLAPNVVDRVHTLADTVSDGRVAKASEKKQLEAAEAERGLQEIAQGSSPMAGYARHVIETQLPDLILKPRDVKESEKQKEEERLKNEALQFQYDSKVRSYWRPR